MVDCAAGVPAYRGARSVRLRRRHEPVLAAHGGRDGARRPAGGPPARLRQPGAVRPVRHARLPRHRRARPADRGRAQRLRQLASTPPTASSTKLRTFDQTQSLHTTPGYDDVTGVGSPNGQKFLAALAAAAAALATDGRHGAAPTGRGPSAVCALARIRRRRILLSVALRDASGSMTSRRRGAPEDAADDVSPEPATSSSSRRA